VAKRQPGAPGRDRFRYGIKAPLLFSATLAVVAGVATSIFATGGNSRVLRMDLGLTAAGIAFIASLVICAMLMMAETPNPEHLGKGSGVNRSSARPDRTKQSAPPPPAGPEPEVEPQFGQRLPDQDR
jgi:hypothetical protein